ncbi:glycoside hydrolase superfamily, partial [Fimicolochytrium jonesii]|uniref:glycoside hydrolase superfamily n=1 Tax=Fimicolochytrium jonesii TaxID=1396493 RepID=UPI0022FF09D7
MPSSPPPEQSPSQPPPPPPLAKIHKVDTRTSHLLDTHGRTRFFHGVNVVFKREPWYPPTEEFDPVTSFCDEDIRILASLNLNCIRLGVHWAGVEPTRGAYSTAYLSAIRHIIQRCATLGIYVLLEFHQDVLHPRWGGHGVPDWVADACGGAPGATLAGFKVPWYLVYFKYAVADAFGKLYANHDGLLDAFAAYWKRVVEEYRDEPNVIGYEIMNEPWPGNHYKNPLLLLPNHASSTTLHKMHTHVALSIRSTTPSALLFFEDATWDTASRAPFVPGGAEFADRSVLAYHYYQPPQRAGINTYLQNRKRDAKRLGCGLFMTEWEMWVGDTDLPTTSSAPLHPRIQKMYETAEAADTHLQSWLGWSYKSFAQGADSADGSLFTRTGARRPEIESLWSRPYASAVAGRVHSMRFDCARGVFELCYRPRWRGDDAGDDQAYETVIALTRATHYPTGFRVAVWPEGAPVRWVERVLEAGNSVVVLTPGAG